ncbi:MAG: cation:dicarboxylate symporter family transporter [Brevinema sp.]
MFSSPLFTVFLKLSQPITLVTLSILALAFILIYLLEKKKIDFSLRMFVALLLGISIGVLIQALSGFPDSNTISSTVWLQETIAWYGFFGSTFVSFIRMLVFPIILISLIQVIITFKSDLKFSTLVRNTLFWLMFTTGIATIIGITLALMTNLGANIVVENTSRQGRQVIDIIGVLLNIIPSNPIKAMNDDNVIAIVIFASLIGSSARIMRSKEKYQRVMDLFADLIDASYRIVMSMAMTIIKFMPYGVVALMSHTLISYGLTAIQQALLFIGLVYLASLIMCFIYCVLLLAKGLNPITFFKKSMPALLMAFSSRSSIGSLPMTISTLEEKLGVNTGTANFVASLGSTMGMNGCAGYFPGMIAIMVAIMTGVPIDASFILMIVIIAVLGSLGIAGIPGSATMAASIMLTGIGMGDQFHLLALVLAIDPLIDMARTMTNVNGAMVSAVCIDKKLGTLDLKNYNS